MPRKPPPKPKPRPGELLSYVDCACERCGMPYRRLWKVNPPRRDVCPRCLGKPDWTG